MTNISNDGVVGWWGESIVLAAGGRRGHVGVSSVSALSSTFSLILLFFPSFFCWGNSSVPLVSFSKRWYEMIHEGH